MTHSPSQRLARSLMNGWSKGDRAALANTIEDADFTIECAPEEQDLVDLVKGIGLRMRDWLAPVNEDEIRAALKLLHHISEKRPEA